MASCETNIGSEIRLSHPLLSLLGFCRWGSLLKLQDKAMSSCDAGYCNYVLHLNVLVRAERSREFRPLWFTRSLICAVLPMLKSLIPWVLFSLMSTSQGEHTHNDINASILGGLIGCVENTLQLYVMDCAEDWNAASADLVDSRMSKTLQGTLKTPQKPTCC